MPSSTAAIGQPVDRVDGRTKVTGAAKYAAEFTPDNLLHAHAFISTIASGRVVSIDTAAARRHPGVVEIFTHENMPRLKPVSIEDEAGKPGQTYIPIQSPEVKYAGQYLGLVIAETLTAAMHAAGLVKVQYAEEPAKLWDGEPTTDAYTPKKMGRKDPPDSLRGDPDGEIASAPVSIREVYTLAQENHNPMEMSATIAAWTGEKLTLYDSTQWLYGVKHLVATALGIAPDNVRVICPFVGGAFGSKGSIWPHQYLTAAAAKAVGRPVKWMLSRQQMFTGCGARPRMRQEIALGATQDGKLVGIIHENMNETSVMDPWAEPAVKQTRMLYACSNVRTATRLVPSNIITPCQMRAPGHAPGTAALEVAMDELAYKLKMDPVELRLRNYAESDEDEKKPFSSKALRECYQQAAEKFGWAKRNPEPGSMKDGKVLIGWGMATATYPTNRQKATVRVRILKDRTALVTTASHDLGTGTYTIMTQIAAEMLGLPLEKVRFQLGDSALPESPVAGGSQTAASTGSAVKAACVKAKAQMDQGVAMVDVTEEAGPAKEQKYSPHAWGAQFAEVRIDPDLRQIQVSRVVSAFAAGRILNPKTAHSQIMGAIVMGIGMALLEETTYDPQRGKIVNDNLSEYLVPVNADVHEIDCWFVEEKDEHANELGVKGVGELGVTGIAAAISNAVFHATGKRVRDLPVTLDKIL